MAVSPEYRHGPSATVTNEDTYGHITGKLGSNLEQDFVHALYYDEWPIEAVQWLQRKRKFDWPSRELIEKIQKLNCHAVPVGDVMSSTQWRVSYLLQERELVWAFNDTQIQCFVLLKATFHVTVYLVERFPWLNVLH